MSGIQDNREYFPRGLVQPESGFRFSTDSLLLAKFALPGVKKNSRGLELGSGCGVVGLGLLLDSDEVSVTGLELDPDMAAASGQNAALLGLEHIFSARQGDVAGIRNIFQPESFDFVLCNPPYRLPGTGRTCPDQAKTRARFETGEGAGLEEFVRAASFALKNRGKAFFVHLAEASPRLLNLLSAHRLEPKRIMFVHGRADKRACNSLVMAQKNAKPGTIVDPPLIMYEQGQALTMRALEFCPWLKCNAG